MEPSRIVSLAVQALFVAVAVRHLRHRPATALVAAVPLVVATAEAEGLPSHDPWGEAHVYLGVGYRLGRNKSRGYIDQHRLDWLWHLTDAGRAHMHEHLTAYRQIYPDVPTDEIGPP